MWPINLINSALSLYGTAVYKIFMGLQKNPSEFSEGGWQMVVTLCDSLKYIATALLVLFFGINVLRQITNVEELRRPETVFRLLFRFVIAKTMVLYSTDILMAFSKIGVGIVKKVCSFYDMDLENYTMASFIDNYNILEGNVLNAKWYEDVPIGIMAVIGFVIIVVLSIITLVTVYGRFFKIYVWAALAPIPLSSLAGEGTASVGWQYLKGFIAICFEGAVIAVAIIMFVVVSPDIKFIMTWHGPVAHFGASVVIIIFRMLLMIGIIKTANNVVKEMTGL